jgi:hypothetical protein
MIHEFIMHARRYAVVLAAAVGMLSPRTLSAQPSTSRLESGTPVRAEFAVNAGVVSERRRSRYGSDIRDKTAVVLLGVRKTYEPHIGVRVVGAYIHGQSNRTFQSSDGGAQLFTSFSVLGAMLVSDVYVRPYKNTELGVHLGVGFAPFLHSTSGQSGNPAIRSSKQQTLLGLGALRASSGPLFIEADLMLLDYGESWTGEYKTTLSPIMLGVRLPLARRR